MKESRDVQSKRNFVLQQGLQGPSPEACGTEYAALLFQPRVVGIVVLISVIFQSPIVFAALGVTLWCNAVFPRWNPFDALRRKTAAGAPGQFRLPPAPEPRRFAQGMAGTMALAVAISLFFAWTIAALVLEAFFLIALTALIFGRFCLGSFIYHLIRGRADFARRTLPWARGA